MIDLRQRLNPSQYASVTTVDGPVLVIAGAGSGKTRAIEYRVLHLVETGVKPESILLLTFTRKAAHEMLSRASRHDPLMHAAKSSFLGSYRRVVVPVRGLGR